MPVVGERGQCVHARLPDGGGLVRDLGGNRGIAVSEVRFPLTLGVLGMPPAFPGCVGLVLRIRDIGQDTGAERACSGEEGREGLRESGRDSEQQGSPKPADTAPGSGER